MKPRTSYRRALRFGFVAIALAYMFLIDAHFSPGGAYFRLNLVAWLLPQMLALGIALLFTPPIELLGGIALAYGSFMALTQLWGTLTLGWLGYFYCTFGACTGVVIAGFRSIGRHESNARIAMSDGFCLVVSGIAINLLVLRLVI